MKEAFKRTFAGLILTAIGAAGLSFPASAAGTTTDQVNALNDEISARKARMEQLNSQVGQYNDLITQKENQAESLANEMSILDNKAAKLQLDVTATQLELDNTNDEIQALGLQIDDETKAAERQKTMLASLLREMHQNEDVSTLELIFGNKNFSDLFDQLSQLESVHKDLHQILEETKTTENDLESKRTSKEEKLSSLTDLQTQLNQEKDTLEESIGSKQFLLTQTKSSEASYMSFISSLRAEQSTVTSDLQALQNQVDQKITSSDGASTGTPVITWPVSHFVITTTFHDPNYVFRNLFPHSGLDLAVPQGSQVHAAAPGYVAFAKTGPDYGNYVMIVHGDGIATLYAHLSKMLVSADQFVSRGDVIGLSGGMPGVQGSGLSTGPHVHFEVRLNGIPVDPMGYIVQ